MKKYLPSFPRVLEIKHMLPGRVRLRIPSLRGNAARAKAFSEKITMLRGIRSVECSVITGSVLVRYDAATLNAVLISSAAKHCFDFNSEMKSNHSLFWHEIREVRKSVDRSLLQHTKGIVDLKALICVLLVGIIFRGVFMRQAMTLPAPFNAMLWLYQNSFARRD